MVVALLAEEDGGPIGQRHPPNQHLLQRVRARVIRSAGKEVPIDGCRQTREVAGGVGLVLGDLGRLEGLHVEHASGLFVGRLLVTHEGLAFAHTLKTHREDGALKVDNLEKTALRRDLEERAPKVLVEELLLGRDPEDVVAMEVIVRKGEDALGLGQCQDNLGKLGALVFRVRVLLEQFVKRAVAGLHDGGHHGHIRQLRPGKGLAIVIIFLVVI
jgi:hypothetical protein